MLDQMGQLARKASYILAQLNSVKKNQVLSTIADLLEQNSTEILNENKKDFNNARLSGLSNAILDRLRLTDERLITIANDVRQVCKLSDPIGQIIDGGVLDSGLRLERRRTPLGVIGVIYEARPNVTIDIAALCLKTGNAAIMRGGKETIYTNKALGRIIQQALIQHNLPAEAIQIISSGDRALVNEMLKLDRYIDMLIPRGGAALHELCKRESTIPVIIGGIGVCHTFVDQSADFDKALAIIENAKTQRPSTCNTLETLLVHQAIAKPFLSRLSSRMAQKNVTLHADGASLTILLGELAKVVPIEEGEFDNEWLSLDLNIAIVKDIDEAIEHIRQHGSQHSDAILTQNMKNADYFVSNVDSAAVYINASTRFTDGGQFGLGSEVAVSTQKLHARGPMGLEALTTYKWIGYGNDLIRH